MEESNFEPELYTEEEMDTIDAYIAEAFGEYKNVFHEIFSTDIHVDICIIPPTKERDYYTLVTMGMGAHKMNVPEELEELKLERAELVVRLPSDWKIHEQDEKWYWPIRLLKSLARLPIECDTWLGWGHTVDNEEPYAENTRLCGAMLVDALTGGEEKICVLPNGEDVNFYQVIPLYREEMEYKMENNAEALLQKMAEAHFHVVVEPDRPNVKDFA